MSYDKTKFHFLKQDGIIEFGNEKLLVKEINIVTFILKMEKICINS